MKRRENGNSQSLIQTGMHREKKRELLTAVSGCKVAGRCRNTKCLGFWKSSEERVAGFFFCGFGAFADFRWMGGFLLGLCVMYGM